MVQSANKIINMTRDEVEKAITDFPVAILPLGATEQHGHHLPLGVDIFLANHLAELVSEKTGAVVIPPMPFGYSWVWRDIPGTISIQQHHVEAIIKDVAHSVSRYGVKMLVLINGHDSNNNSMKYAVRELADELEMPVMYLFYPSLSEVMEKNCESGTWHGMIHACEFETSLMLATKKELVQMKKAVREYPEKPTLYGKTTISLGDLSKSGVYGDASLATEEKGEQMIELFAEKMTALLLEGYGYLTK
ncbi:TPA: creatininase family protein [Listeria monocytogenes]|uniref:creatininase family protein n=1 Tax=Listeria monocytogenes TaxID=1639 RepID=UPI0010DB1492|nr:creatininase family protein [Listeria monocytogenes]EAE7095244.1 creatininase family protein [Listeria monocytogenes]HDA6216414.1 creatininase family protein [Listeria monocytogenes]HDA6222575.1 creatininase family protein [Listeria monocytogenes]HDA6225680.1 creatininase family protein [Listeria monocytogenes]HDA6231898.1 creatininase family protein [Listeria monocytogenes]